MRSVYVTEYPHPDSCAAAIRLRDLVTASYPRFYLVHNPKAADLILVAGHGNQISDYEYIFSSISHPVINSFPDKSFTACYRDKPIIFHHGIYESAIGNPWSQGRVVAGFYQFSGTINPKVIQPGPGRARKLYLASFIGRNSHPIRSRLFAQKFNRGDIIIEDSSSFHMWSEQSSVHKLKQMRHYGDVLSSSKFAICPRGYGTGSIRLLEALKAGVAPVVISDEWIPPGDPLWQEFCLTLPEAEIHQLENLLQAEEPTALKRGALARAYYQSALVQNVYLDYLWCHLELLKHRKLISERYFWMLRYLLAGFHLTKYCSGQAINRMRVRWAKLCGFRK
jgi:hypothetical protein